MTRGQGEQSNDRTRQPVIPDGGLSTSMPDWLRKPPSWKPGSPSADQAPVTTVAPGPQTDTSTLPAPLRSVPPADTSPIDPRTLLDLTDLPDWLQAIATRVGQTGQPNVRDSGAADTQERGEAAATVPAPNSTPDRESQVSSTQEQRRATPVTVSTHRSWWATDRALGAFMVLVLLILLTIVVLVIS